MTEEEKQQQIEKGKLLVADLCARLPYKVKLQKVDEPDTTYELYSINVETLEICFWTYKGKSLRIADSDKLYRFGTQRYKPYFRPFSSMTDEEKSRMYSFMEKDASGFPSDSINKNKINEYMSWVLSRHFDINHLIEKGLAIEMTTHFNA